MSDTTPSLDTSPDRIRYAVVGLGWFAQVAVLPAFANAERNSELAGLVSGDDEKLAKLGERYGVPEENRVHYDAYGELLESGEIDAVYVATPNHLHRDYVLPALEEGIDVICEKPLAVTEDDCRAMVEAAEANDVFLMTAYRLHFEEVNMKAAELVRSGALGDVRLFSAVFTNHVTNPDDIRLGPVDKGGGTLYDIGIYCINAARYLFADEPVQVTALSASGDGPHAGTESLTGAVMRFPGGRLATFSTCFSAQPRDTLRVLGTEGELVADPAFEFQPGLGYRLIRGDEVTTVETEPRDQVAPELLYFSDCVLNDEAPEPSGREGLADVRIIEALHRSAREGRAIDLEPMEPAKRPGPEQVISCPAFDKPELVAEEAP